MKKLCILSAMFALFSAGASAQTLPTHENYLPMGSKTTKWYEAYNRWNAGTPLYNDDADAAENENFFISRIKPRDRFIFTGTQVKESLNPNRKLLWWCPMGESSWNAVPSYFFGGEVFSMWSYTDIYGNWTAPMIQAPGAFLDVAHKNGVAAGVVAAIAYGAQPSPTDGESGQLIATMYNNTSDKLLKYMRYYGIDGIGWNSEFSWKNMDMGKFRNLMGDCYAKAASAGLPLFNNAWYSFTANGGGFGDYSVLSSGCSDWFHYNNKTVSSVYFLNYNWGSSQLSTSQSTARGFAGRSSFDVFGGMDFQGRSSAAWTALKDYDISFGLWGAHNMNMMYENRGEDGSSSTQLQRTYQLMSENVFTGSSFNPVNAPGITNLLVHSSKATAFHGFSSFITARSTLTCDNLANDPFVTYFNLGNGNFFNVQGETSFNKEWYNIGMQDYLPTWRWWWTNGYMGKSASDASKDLKAEFTWDDAWFGGSCLQISGATTTAYLQLFKTKYKTAVTGDYITIRYKVLSGTGSLSWACSTEDAPTTEVSATIKNNMSETDGWQEVRTSIGSGRTALKVHNATLALIGLKFSNTSSDFKVLIGEMTLTRGTSPAPAAPVITKSKTLARNYKGLDMKVIFKMDYTPSSVDVPVYNKDVNTWFFKVYTQQQGKDQVMCTATTSWASYVVGVPYDLNDGGKVRIGVSAVSLDGKSESAITWGDWLDVPANTVVEGFTVDKPIIKANEDFSVSFDDPTHPAAEWQIKSSKNDAVKYSATAHDFTTAITEEGIYDLYLTQNGKTEVYRGMIQISPNEVGAMPEIKTLTGNGASENVTADAGDQIKFEYTGRTGTDGNVSRGLRLSEKAFGIPVSQLSFGDRTPFTLCFWLYIDKFNHGSSGTQFLNIRTASDRWPASDWGYIWSTIGSTGSYGLAFRYKTENGGTSVNFENFEFKARTWYHVAMVIDYTSGRQFSLYVNGKLINKSAVITDLYAWQQSNVIMIGGKAAGRAGLDGYLDEFQLYNKALSADEVSASMQHQTDVPSSLVGYWDFETEAKSDNTIASTGANKSLIAGIYEITTISEGNNQYMPKEIDFSPGTPFISGDKYKITTVPSWTYKGATTVSSNGNGESGSSDVFYQKPGTYSATLTLENGWGKNSKTINFVEIDPTGIEDMTLDQMMAFPNPFVDDVYVRFTDEGVYKVEIFDNAGRLVNSSSISVGSGEMVNIPVNGASGIYFIKVRNSDSLLKVMKVIKK